MELPKLTIFGQPSLCWKKEIFISHSKVLSFHIFYLFFIVDGLWLANTHKIQHVHSRYPFNIPVCPLSKVWNYRNRNKPKPLGKILCSVCIFSTCKNKNVIHMLLFTSISLFACCYFYFIMFLSLDLPIGSMGFLWNINNTSLSNLHLFLELCILYSSKHLIHQDLHI